VLSSVSTPKLTLELTAELILSSDPLSHSLLGTGSDALNDK